MKRIALLAFTAFVACGLSAGVDESKNESDRTSWLEQVKGYQVPEWFADANRVHAHTRLSAVVPYNQTRHPAATFTNKWLGTPVFADAPKHFKAMGFDVFTRHIKSGDEPAWWPSAVGAVLPQATDRNIAKEIIEQAHAQGMRIIVYYRHMEDAGMAKEHPEWICRDPSGKPYVTRGLKMCFNTPYRDFVEKRLLELTDMGADGFYFDEIHQPTVCTCPSCKKDGKNREQIIREMFLRYRQVVHKRNPKVVLLISCRFEGLGHDLWRMPDTCKIEPHVASKYGGNSTLGYALGLAFIRDAADGKPAHLWWSPTRPSSLLDCAWTLAFGHIFNFDVWEAMIADPEAAAYRMARQHASLGATLTPYLKRTIPVRWALVHYPEGRPDGMTNEQTVLPPFQSIMALHVPTGIIIDSQLREGIPSECGLLVIPDPRRAPLGDPQVSHHLSFFQQRGGQVVICPIKEDHQKSLRDWQRKAPLQATATSDAILMTVYRNAPADRWTVILLNPTSEKISAARLILSRSRKPLSVTDIMAKKDLPVVSRQESFLVEIPPFTLMSAVSVNWEKAAAKQGITPDKK